MIEQVPFATRVTVAFVELPESVPAPTVHTPVELLVNVVASEEVVVALIENAAAPYTLSESAPKVTVWSALTMESVASAEVTLETAPLDPELLTTTEYVAASENATELIVYDDDVAPLMFTPSLRHW